MARKKMNSKNKKQIQRNFNLTMMLIVVVLSLFLGEQYIQTNFKEQLMNKFITPSDNVKKYTPLLYEELEKVELEEYTPVLAALMQQESKGRGGDPMQASESIGLAPNSINDPNQSIKEGVKYFHRVFEYGEKRKVDLPTVIQAYNMGIGYVDFVAVRGGKHNEEIAKEFSYIQVKKNPQTYDCGGDQSNFRYPYCYGDFSYSTKVLNHLEAFNPVSNSKQTKSES